MMRRLAISLSFVLAGCAGTVDWSQIGSTPAQQAENSADVVACDRQVTAVAAVYPNADAAPGTPQWRAAMNRKMGLFGACMRDKGWLKLPGIGWQKARPTNGELPNEEGGGD
jgi:hypothetical protein